MIWREYRIMTIYSFVFSQNKFINKHELVFPFEERGLQFGDGVYEVIRIYNGVPFLLDEHIERLFKSLQAIKIQIKFTTKQLKAKLLKLIKLNNVTSDAIIYLQTTRGSTKRNHSFPSNVEPNI